MQFRRDNLNEAQTAPTMKSVIDIVHECSIRLAKETFEDIAFELRQIIQRKIEEKNRLLREDIIARIAVIDAQIERRGGKTVKRTKKSNAKLTKQDYLKAYSVDQQLINAFFNKKKTIRRRPKQNSLKNLIHLCRTKNRPIFKSTDQKDQRMLIKGAQDMNILLNRSERKIQAQATDQQQVNYKEILQAIKLQSDCQSKEEYEVLNSASRDIHYEGCFNEQNE